DQPYVEDASPIAQSPEYVPEFDFEMHPKDDADEDPEEDPVDYPADGGNDSNDEEESSEDEEDDEIDAEADEEEEEEHPASADSVVIAPTAADQAPSAEETEPSETDESAATPPPHPAYHSFSTTPPILSPPSPILAPALPPSPIRSLGYRAAMIQLRDEAASASPPSSQLPSASRREDRPKVTLPPRKRLDIALGPRLLFRDRRAHAYTRQLMETEARMSREAWVRATDASDLVHGEVISVRTTVL
nr:hypothetical protein [Tanacetum cinerariifolium]